jgi:hypothetical protein
MRAPYADAVGARAAGHAGPQIAHPEPARPYNRGMQGEITGVILVLVFAAVALLCAVLVAKLWRAAAAPDRRQPD